jgi:hypothetical protein
MRTEALLAAEWTADTSEVDPARTTEAAIVRFVDRRGRTGYVALGCRVRRYVGFEAGRDALPAADPAYFAATIH